MRQVPVLAALIAILALPVPGQTTEPVTVKSTAREQPGVATYVSGSVEQIAINSSVTGENYQLFVYLPAEYRYTKTHYPVLYMFDGQLLAGMAQSMADLLIVGKQIQPVIIVGIGFEAVLTRDFLPRRLREFTPTSWHEFPGSGGGVKFVNFVISEVIPFIEDNFRAKPDTRALSSYALSGAIGVYILFERPDVFKGHLLIEPRLWWDDPTLFDLERAFAESGSALPVKLFTALGTEDQAAYVDAWRRFIPIMKKRNYRGLRMSAAEYEGANHFTVFPQAFTDGLLYLYGPD